MFGVVRFHYVGVLVVHWFLFLCFVEWLFGSFSLARRFFDNLLRCLIGALVFSVTLSSAKFMVGVVS